MSKKEPNYSKRVLIAFKATGKNDKKIKLFLGWTNA